MGRLAHKWSSKVFSSAKRELEIFRGGGGGARNRKQEPWVAIFFIETLLITGRKFLFVLKMAATFFKRETGIGEKAEMRFLSLLYKSLALASG